MEIVENIESIGGLVDGKAGAGHVIVVSAAEQPDRNLVSCLESLRYSVEVQPSTSAAVTHIVERRSKIHVVVIDRRGSPTADLVVAKRIASDPRIADLPIMLIVGSKDDEQIAAAFDAGIKTYLRAPFPVSLLDAGLRALRRERQKRAAERLRPVMEQSVLPMAEACKFRIRTPAELRQIIPILAAFFPDRKRAEIGIGELLSNAIEHGNLEIGRELKAKLAEEGRLKNEIYERLKRPEYANRFVKVAVTRKDGGIMLVVNDDGPGFEWKEHMDVNPALGNSEHGRGIARARYMAFDKLTYNPAGNQAVAVMTGAPSLDW